MNRIWGHCAVCQQLVRIVPGAYKGDGRAQWWWIQPHQADGAECEGSGRKV